MAPLRYAAKFDPFPSLDCARVEGMGMQSKERKGSNFALWQPWNKAGERFSGTICPILFNALVKRKRHVSKDLVRSFAKALAAMALRASAEESSR